MSTQCSRTDDANESYEALHHRLLALPEGALEQPILAAGRERSAYEWIRMLLMGFAGHVGEMEALKAMQTRAKQ